ncbi:MAG: SEC-C domain-containing protein, partial [Actinobacteria bacterium]|nr:SEC-C domain-containing protein [Actinomycetota bacterium]
KVERQLGVDNLYDLSQSNLVHQLQQALRAKELYKRDKDYIVEAGEVKIVDEFTGRTLEGRRWSDGLHQAVEAKERVKIKEENHTWATVTLQNYFRLYEKLSGMTGTAETEASEFANTYDLPVVPIPTNLPMQRQDQGDLIYKTELAKFNAVIEDLVERYDAGQPVLVGTASVEKSEVLSEMLKRKGIPHSVLNAKHHAREAEIVAQAGRLHAITVATNMAGRGVDILLGGNPEGLARQEVLAQGMELDSDEGRALYEQLVPKFSVETKAEGEKVRELGGLYVLGSERHESRRIDNQLRGRAGRQGDPGESRFYLSLEDELMRLFATGAMSWVMGKALPDDVPIEAKMVTKAIERAQNTVEARNAEIRKDVLKYDEVMNEQRKVIYQLRSQIIDGDDLKESTIESLGEALQRVVESYCPSDYQEDWDVDGLLLEVALYYPTRFVADELKQASRADDIYESLLAEGMAHYEAKEQEVEAIEAGLMRQVERDIMLQIIDQKWREHLSEMDYLREGINLRAMGQQDPLVAWQAEGYSMFEQMLDGIDDDYVKYVMHAEVQVERPAPAPSAFDLNQATYEAPEDPVQSLPSASTFAPLTSAGGDGAPPMTPAAQQAPSFDDEPTMEPIVKGDNEKLGRNQPCWCGSGKKFKMCHGR